MMESILDLLGDVAELGNEVAKGRANQFNLNKNKMAEGWMNAMTGKKQSLFNPDTSNNDDELDEDYDEIDDSIEDIYEEEEEKPLKKSKPIPHAKIKKSMTAKGTKQQLQQKQVVMQGIEARNFGAMNQMRLQEGIILSEILGAPVSRKRKNRIGRI